MSPLDIEVLLHYHTRPVPHPDINTVAVQASISSWVSMKMMHPTTASPYFTLTQRGEEGVKTLLSLHPGAPLPSQLQPRQHRPFDLAAAKAGAKLVTVAGAPARIVAFDRVCPTAGAVNGPKPILALLTQEDGSELPKLYTIDGRCGVETHPNDLRIALIEKSGWLNLYAGGNTSKVYPTQAEANEGAGANRTACIEIHWEE